MARPHVTRHAIEQYLTRISPRGGRVKALSKIRKVMKKGSIYDETDDGSIIRLRFGDVLLVTSDTGVVITVCDAKSVREV